MSRLPYLLDEMCAGLEIYFSGRTGGQYYKSAFLLCDDYVELTAKLYMVTLNPQWSDQASGRFKQFHTVLTETANEYHAANSSAPSLQTLVQRISDRRRRRNDFFHSTQLLDLNVTHRMCVEAFVDLLELGEKLFESEWSLEVASVRNLATLILLVRLEKRCFSDPHLLPQLQDMLAAWPRNRRTLSSKGSQIAVHPEDLHLRLCVINGAAEFREKVEALLNS